jgi:glutamate synthase domain-containing protein 1
MCGIVGLFLKDPKLEPECGALLSEMLAAMSDRGPDSAGVAIYGPGKAGKIRLTLRAAAETDFDEVAGAIKAVIGHDIELVRHGVHAVICVNRSDEARVRKALENQAPMLRISSVGRRMQMFKGVGAPADVARRCGLDRIAGTHAIGHTRMATESKVTIDGAHPFTTAEDQCLVHNGSLSNHNRWRLTLARAGVRFATENDSEVAAAYLSWRLEQGLSLTAALQGALGDLDGFYTFVVGTEAGFGVLRDPIGCKPAVMAETDRYVAFGSEYRALVNLPGVTHAHVWEPAPATPYFWERAA